MTVRRAAARARISRWTLGPLVGCLSLGGSISGCSDDHSLLAQKPPVADAARPADAASEMRAPGDEPPAVPPDTRPTDAPVDADPGPWALTWLNGVVDQPNVRLCFVPVVDGGEAVPVLPPVPSAPGLAFGEQLVLSAIAGIDVATMDIHPYLVFGGGAQSSCADLLARSTVPDAEAGAPRASTVALPAILAGTLADSHSYLAVMTGCAAAPPRPTDSGPDPACGGDPTGSGAGLLLVRLSRQTSRLDLGFQVLHASQASPSLSVEIDDVGTLSRIAGFGPLGFGQLVPPGEPTLVPRVSLSQGATRYSVQVSAAAASSPPAILASIFAASGIGNVDLTTEGPLTLVLIGATPGIDAGQLGHPFGVAAVRNTPLLALTNDGG